MLTRTSPFVVMKLPSIYFVKGEHTWQRLKEKHDQLVARNYQGNVRLRVKNGHTYAAPDGNQNAIIHSGGAFDWRTVFAVYTGHNSHYWIYRGDSNRAWQVNPGVPNNNLTFWEL